MKEEIRTTVGGNKFSIILICAAVLLCAIPFAVFAQNQRKPKKTVLPRVGVIKDVGAAWDALSSDCNDLHLFRPKDKAAGEKVFIGSYDGRIGRMNLGGRDTPLVTLKTTHWYDARYPAFRYEYSDGKGTLITVSRDHDLPPAPPFRVQIVVQKGRARLVFTALGYPHCD